MWRNKGACALAASAGVLLCTAVAGTVPARAAGIGWEKPGAFQSCLDGKAKAWIDAKVELVVNDDPNMGAIDDTAVAEWATRALKECAAKASGGDQASELQFMKYMAHWRDHIYKAADEMRHRDRPD